MYGLAMMMTIPTSTTSKNIDRFLPLVIVWLTRPIPQKGPNRATANVVLMATMVLLLSFGLQFVILDNVKSATMVNAVILNLGMYSDTDYGRMMTRSQILYSRPNPYPNPK